MTKWVKTKRSFEDNCATKLELGKEEPGVAGDGAADLTVNGAWRL
jgi:hypothetical protein